jgi:hypothetical protein
LAGALEATPTSSLVNTTNALELGSQADIAKRCILDTSKGSFS